ncbi:MAG: hypothetical protein IJ144_05895 [Prevotella sp.]|nr:hypothetical protein [Prevotella sp.]
MKHEIRSLSGLLGARIISTDSPKCETCKNDAAGTNCVKLILAGGHHICVAKKGAAPKVDYPDSEASKQCGTLTCGYRNICTAAERDRCPNRTTPNTNPLNS